MRTSLRIASTPLPCGTPVNKLFNLMGNSIDEPENATHKRCSCKEQIKSSTCLILGASTLGISSVRSREEIHGMSGRAGTPKGNVLRRDYQH